MAYLGSLMTGFIGGMDAGNRMIDARRRREWEDFSRMEKRLGMAGDHIAAMLTDPMTGMMLPPEKITQQHADNLTRIMNRFGIANQFLGVNPNVDKRNPLASIRILPNPNDPENLRNRVVAFDLNMKDGSVQPMTWNRSDDPADQVMLPTIGQVGQMLMIETNPQAVARFNKLQAKYAQRGAGGGRRSSSGRRGGGGGAISQALDINPGDDGIDRRPIWKITNSSPKWKVDENRFIKKHGRKKFEEEYADYKERRSGKPGTLEKGEDYEQKGYLIGNGKYEFTDYKWRDPNTETWYHGKGKLPERPYGGGLGPDREEQRSNFIERSMEALENAPPPEGPPPPDHIGANAYRMMVDAPYPGGEQEAYPEGTKGRRVKAIKINGKVYTYAELEATARARNTTVEHIIESIQRARSR